MALISVVVLNWNGRDLLADCLRSLAGQLDAEVELIVVDNGSRDGSAAYVHHDWPDVRLLALTTNRGFSGGVNAGLHVARGEYLVLFNNDAVAAPDFLANLTAPLRADPALGAVAGVLQFAHRPELVASAGICIHRDGVALDDRMLLPIEDLPAAPVPAWGASGGAVAYRRAALLDTGGFDEGYFAYLEDVDLSWRLRMRGWSTLLAPQARALHVYSATGGEGSPFKDWLVARNRWRVIMRCLPTPLLRRDWPLILRYELLACAQAALRGRWTTITGRIAAWRDRPALLSQRREIQQRCAVPLAELDRWVLPARDPAQVWRQASALGQVLSDRTETKQP
jgi:GT2 family glycosyltransferase